MDDTLEIQPTLTPAEQTELASIAYLLSHLESMRARDLISSESYTTVESETQARRAEIERGGRIRTAVARAQRLAVHDPVQTLAWANRVRAMDQGRLEGWSLAIDALHRLRRDDEAITLASEGVDRFPALEAKLADLRRTREGREAAPHTAVADEETLTLARAAVKVGDDATVIALCTPWLERHPDHPEALVMLAFALRRVGRIDEALTLYRRLTVLQPLNRVWPQWIRTLEGQQDHSPAPRRVESLAAAPTPEPSQPVLSWKSVAGEFLEEHWQKLILCLAVLLIVVSSTVGAHLLLGPRLWSPVGKCSLALVYTLMFAAFGTGLVRWGAERAGRMMLLTTLIVVPVNFMLAGEMRLLIEPSLSRLLVLALDVSALFFVTRRVARALGWEHGATWLASALVVLSASDVATARGVPWSWGVAAFLVPPWFYLGAVWWLNIRDQAESEAETQEFTYSALGLLTFAYLSGLIRAAAVLGSALPRFLFAGPVMLTAIALVLTAHHLGRFEKDPRRIQLLRFGGYLLSALAFAIVLTQPPGPSLVNGANTLGVALLGLGLYGVSLWAYRHPAYLYVAIGALVVGEYGALELLAGPVRAIEGLACQILGYSQRLPLPFKALNGLVLNTLLGLLALRFAGRWREARLARHCHYLGVPLSIAACLLSAFETKAAVLCLSSYALLYAIGAVRFSEPRLVYLAGSAFSGALWFGSWLVPGMTPGARVLGTAVLGGSFRGLGGLLSRGRELAVYRPPLIRMALALSAAALSAAVLLVTPPSSAVGAATATFLLATALCALLVTDLPYPALVHLTTAGLLGASLGVLSLASGRAIVLSPGDGLATALLGLVLLTAIEALRRRTTLRATVFANGLPDAVPVLVFLAVAMVAQAGRNQFVPISTTLALGGVALLWLTKFRRERPYVYLGIGLAVASQLVLGGGRVSWADPGIGLAALALIAAVSGLVLWRVGYAIQCGRGTDFYAVPCFRMALGLTPVVFALALGARGLSRAAFPASAAALLADGLVLILLTTAWRTALLTYGAVFSLVSATYLILFSVGESDPSKAYVLGLVAVLEGVGLWSLGLWQSLGAGRVDRTRVYVRPLFVSSLLLTLLAIPMSLSSAGTMTLIALAFVLMIKSFPSTGWTYPALAALGFAFDLTVFSRLNAVGQLGAAVLGTFGLWGGGILVRRVGPGLCRRWQLPPLALAIPLFNVAVLSGLISLGLVLTSVLSGDAAWWTHSWVPLSLAIFCLLMVEARPGRGWIHGFAALASAGSFMAVAPAVTIPSGWLLVGMVLALFWLVLGHDFLSVEPWLCRRFALEPVGAGDVLERWSVLHCTVACSLSGAAVMLATVGSIYLGGTTNPGLGAVGWWPVGPALVLALIYVVTQGGRLGDGRPVALNGLLTLLIWWVGLAPGLLRFGVLTAPFDALATAALALAIVGLGRRGDVGIDVTARQADVVDRMAFFLAAIACAFTLGMSPTPALGTYLLAASAFGYLAVARHRVVSAYAGALAWSGFCTLLVFQLARPRWIAEATPPLFDVAVGSTVALFSIWAFATWLKTTHLVQKSWGVERRGRVVRALERMALLGSLWAVGSVGWLAVGPDQLDDFVALSGVGLLMANGAFDVLVARRWNASWLVYLAQGTLLGAYFTYRRYFPVSVSTDAAVLTLLGYLDLGLAEVMQRFRMNLYARPTLYVSLLLPLLPPAMAIANGQLDELSLFLMFTTAAFYGVACYTRQWKSLGYAAAVLLNAILWIAWSRVGWRLADHPQLYLIPVGLSAILFAEVNRREFGNELVNAIRGSGLALVYASLALPIWQFQSFGAWLTLLLLSLTGILVGIGLRIQTFLWLGLVGFVLDVVYQLGRVSSDNALARWGVMLSLGILLILFVALNEKKRIVATMRDYYEQVRQWE